MHEVNVGFLLVYQMIYSLKPKPKQKLLYLVLLHKYQIARKENIVI